MRILLLEPYMTGSHAAWAEGYARHSEHQVEILSLPGRWWKWRMHGGAVTLARLAETAVVERGGPPDLILATDMLDLTSWLAMTRRWSAGIPAALYMHENQLTYPLPSEPGTGPMRLQQGERDLHYAFINYASMLAADRVLFNSQYHLDSWFQAVPSLLTHFPDHNELASIQGLRSHASVLPLGLDLGHLDAVRPKAGRDSCQEEPPLILWNHRWEFDKNPGTFFEALITLAQEGVPFRVGVCGQRFRQVPIEFIQARQRLGDRIVQWGYVERRQDYAQLLWSAQVVVSTAIHDFFGAAVVEAMYCDCWPVVPRRLAYPEHIPPEAWDKCLYEGGLEGLLRLLRQALTQSGPSLRTAVSHYDWQTLAPQYDSLMVQVAQS